MAEEENKRPRDTAQIAQAHSIRTPARSKGKRTGFPEDIGELVAQELLVVVVEHGERHAGHQLQPPQLQEPGCQVPWGVRERVGIL